MDRIYFDNSSTTRVYPEAAAVMMNAFSEDFGNPSSLHQMGIDAENHVKDAAAIIAETLGVDPKEIFFTSGGTESNNWALYGAAKAMCRKGKHIITTQIEHPSVSEPLKALEKEGFEITKIGLDDKGDLDTAELESAVRDDTILVSVILVNNEAGILSPWEELGGIIKSKNPNTLYHGDAIQAYGKYDIRPKKCKMDLLSVSGHKIHGPKGTGFLYINKKIRIVPMIYGGGQQDGMRSGTDNVPGIAGLGEAARISYQNLERNREILYGLKDYFIDRLSELDDVKIHSRKGEEGAPHIVAASFTGVGSEVLLHSLEDRGIYVSAGSACSTHKRSKSPTLTALGASKAELDSYLRFSFCETNTENEVDITIDALKEFLPVLRRYRSY